MNCSQYVWCGEHRLSRTNRWWRKVNIKSDLLTEPIFVGREAEIDELNACLASAIDRKGKTVFICGEAGTGKTRLVNEFLKIVQTKEIATMVGWCLSNASVPYFPFIEAFKKQITASNNEAKLSPSH